VYMWVKCGWTAVINQCIDLPAPIAFIQFDIIYCTFTVPKSVLYVQKE